jgi:hypothetical protein
MKAIAAFMMFLYHLKTIKQKLWLKLVVHAAFCTLKKLYHGCMRDGMNKLTLLESYNRHIMDFDIVKIGFHQDDCCGCLLERASKMRQSPLVNHL